MTHGSLMRDIPRLEPDDEFVDRLAQLAAASNPTRGGVVVPVAFRGPAARSIATAAAVAAIASGAAVAAHQLGQPHDNAPIPPISSVGTSGADDNRGSHHQRTAHNADPSGTSAEGAQPQGHDSTGPDSSSSTQAVVPAHDNHGSPGSDDHHGTSTPGDDATGHQGGEDSGPGSSGPGSDVGSSGPSGGNNDGSGGKDSGSSGGGSDSDKSGSGSDTDFGTDGSGD